jgi:stage III sporulation protein AF
MEDKNMNLIYEWVRNIVIFLVLTTIIGNLLGKSSYKKYINLITGIILVILVVSPLLHIFKLENSLDYYLSTNFFTAEAEDFNGRLKDMEQTQMTAITKEYKGVIQEQVTGLLESKGLYLVKLDIIIEENDKSENYGKLKSLNITASVKKENNKSNKSNVTKVIIDKIKISNKEESETGKKEDFLSPDEINVKNLFSDFYNMNPDNINISIQDQ